MLHYVAPLWSCGLTCSPLRQGILAYGRTRGYFYAYYITETLTATVCEGSMMCLSLAYVVSQHVPASSWRHQQAVSWLDCCAEPYASSLLQADRVPEARRAAAFGVFSGVCTAGFVASTVAARFLPVSSTCQVCVREHTPAGSDPRHPESPSCILLALQVAAVAAVVTAVYMKAFLQETDGGASSCSCDEEASRPLCIPSSSSEELSPKLPPLRKAPSLSEIAALLTSR